MAFRVEVPGEVLSSTCSSRTHIANLNAILPAACLRPKRSQKQTYWQGASSGAGSFDLNKQWRVRTRILYPCLGLFFQHTSQPFNNRLSGPQRRTSTIFLKISAIAHNLLTRSKYNMCNSCNPFNGFIFSRRCLNSSWKAIFGEAKVLARATQLAETERRQDRKKRNKGSAQKKNYHTDSNTLANSRAGQPQSAQKLKLYFCIYPSKHPSIYLSIYLSLYVGM